MTARIFRITICCLLFFMLPSSAVPQQKVDGSDVRKSLHEFVQDFYDWYVPKALSDHPGPAWDFALKYRKRAFSPELFRALKEGSDAQAKANDLVGLDFDPFLNSQAIAELVRNDRQWEFVNFLYPDETNQYPKGADLLSNLKGLRDDRAKSRSSKTRATN